MAVSALFLALAMALALITSAPVEFSEGFPHVTNAIDPDEETPPPEDPEEPNGQNETPPPDREPDKTVNGDEDLAEERRGDAFVAAGIGIMVTIFVFSYFSLIRKR